MNRLLVLFLTVLFLNNCNLPVENGAFVGEWYVVGIGEGNEHWSIQKNNSVTIRNRFGEVTGEFKLKDSFLDRHFGDAPYYYFVSSDKKDTIGTTWVEMFYDEYKVPKDTIRFYHSFVMLRNKKPPVTNLSKIEIVEFLDNSYWEYTRDSTKVELFLTDSLLDNQRKRAYANISGCIEYESNEQEWFVDTLTQKIVLQIQDSNHHYYDLLLIKEINNDIMKVDRDDVYWFNENLLLKKTQPWDMNNFNPSSDFERIYSTPACGW